MRNILYIAHTSSKKGGASFSLLSLIVGLHTNENLVVLLPSKGELQRELERLSIEYIIVCYLPSSALFFNSNKFLYALKYILYKIINSIALYRINKYIKPKKFDIIHTNSAVIDIGYLLSLKNGIPHIWHLREFQDKDYNLRPYCGFEKFKDRLSKSYCIAITKSVANHYQLKQNFSVVYNGILVKSKNIDKVQKEKQFIFCGSLTYNKGVEEAIIAFSKFLEVNNEYKLVICGDAQSKDYYNHLKKMVSNLNIVEKVVFTSFSKNVEIIISSSLALLMCSKFEALGRVTIESLMLKTLVIGKKTGGTVEILQSDFLYGFLYSEIDELFSKMLIASHNPKLVEEVVMRSYEYSNANFSLDKHIYNITKIYNKLCPHLD